MVGGEGRWTAKITTLKKTDNKRIYESILSKKCTRREISSKLWQRSTEPNVKSVKYTFLTEFISQKKKRTKQLRTSRIKSFMDE